MSALRPLPARFSLELEGKEAKALLRQLLSPRLRAKDGRAVEPRLRTSIPQASTRRLQSLIVLSTLLQAVFPSRLFGRHGRPGH
jgi:hypothetical protein